MLLNFKDISFLCKHNLFIDGKHTQWNLDTNVKVFHESISYFMKCPWKCLSKKSFTVYPCLKTWLLSFLFDVFLSAKDHSFMPKQQFTYSSVNCKIFCKNISHAKYFTKYSKPTSTNFFFRKDGDFPSIQEVLI